MLQTYPATLRDGKIEWGNEGAPAVPPHETISVHVTLLPAPGKTHDPVAAMAAIEAFAAAGGPTSFGDPVEWQREIRKDRPLVGREE